MKKTIPDVSIIIPMYNTEKYIGECLDSILAQTLQDFEVIVVDDCSTDKSCAVVENYLPKFGGKLQLIRSEKNAGSPGVPRNKGIASARGKYIFFMDSDDALIEDALNILYNAAEKFNVDIVHCEKYYRAPDNTVTTDRKFLKESSDERADFVSKPTYVSDKLEDRVRDFAMQKMIGYPWNKLIRRNLIVNNNIEFPILRCGEDHIFSFFVICLAKKILRIPTPVYVWRKTPEGVTYGKLSVEKMIHRWTDSLFRGVGIVDKFMDNFELFNKKPEYRHFVFETFILYHCINLQPVYAQIPAYQLDGLIRKELDEVQDKTALTAFLFARMTMLNINMIRQNQIIQQLQAQLAAK